MDENTVKALLSRAASCAIGVLGDFCVDAYWELRLERGEPSIETGIVTTPVSAARYFPGGAGNIAANLRSLGARRIFCFGALGDDPFGLWLKNALFPENDDGDFLLRIGRKDYHTPVYGKPLLNGREQSRFDLGGVPLADDEAERLTRSVGAALPKLDVLIINQQLRNGLHSRFFRRELAALLKRAPGTLTVIFDGREHLDAYPGTILKIDACAASRLAFGREGAAPERSGSVVAKHAGGRAVVTDGGNGCFVFDRGKTSFVPAIRRPGPVDPVGAGDSFVSGFALALADGAPMAEAAELGSACAAVTVGKIAQTGVPTPEEVTALFSSGRE